MSESNFFLIAGPCVIEDYNMTYQIAGYLKALTERLGIPFIFKSSYDKANRSAITSYRGPGLENGLKVLAAIKSELSIKVISDVHRIGEVARAAQVLDALQIPAFLFRQTDFVIEVAKTKKPINVKKGQFASPNDMRNVVNKIRSVSTSEIMLTERGSTFGYHDLVVDMRSIYLMKQLGCPVIFDATHSVQRPGGLGNRSGGNRELVPTLARAAIAAGADGLFVEVHPNPDKALCDGPNSLDIRDVEGLLKSLLRLHKALSA